MFGELNVLHVYIIQWTLFYKTHVKSFVDHEIVASDPQGNKKWRVELVGGDCDNVSCVVRFTLGNLHYYGNLDVCFSDRFHYLNSTCFQKIGITANLNKAKRL